MNLLDMVKALTQPDRVPMWVEAEGRKVLFTRVDPPLLDRVKARIGAEQGNPNGGGSPASQRSLIDIAAFTLWHEVNGQVRSWFQQNGLKAPRELNQALSQWLVWFQSYPREVELQRHHESVLSGWLSRALDVVDPPQRVELKSPCPSCHARWVIFGSGQEEERRSSLTAWLRSADDCGAGCGACGRVWAGAAAMRALNVSIDDKMRALGFTDRVAEKWYWCGPVGKVGGVTLNLTLVKETERWETLVLDEDFGQPYFYGGMSAEIREPIMADIDAIIVRMQAAGLPFKVDHRQYGWVDPLVERRAA